MFNYLLFYLFFSFFHWRTITPRKPLSNRIWWNINYSWRCCSEKVSYQQPVSSFINIQDSLHCSQVSIYIMWYKSQRGNYFSWFKRPWIFCLTTFSWHWVKKSIEMARTSSLNSIWTKLKFYIFLVDDRAAKKLFYSKCLELIVINKTWKSILTKSYGFICTSKYKALIHKKVRQIT